MRHVGASHGGGNYPSIRKHIDRLGLDTSHFEKSWGQPGKKIPLTEILVRESTYVNTTRLKERLMKTGRLQEVCAACGLGPEWQGKPLTLHLDHVNGDRADHRIANLRILWSALSHADAYLCRKKQELGWRRRWDSNPRGLSPLPAFETGPLAARSRLQDVGGGSRRNRTPVSGFGSQGLTTRRYSHDEGARGRIRTCDPGCGPGAYRSLHTSTHGGAGGIRTHEGVTPSPVSNRDP